MKKSLLTLGLGLITAMSSLAQYRCGTDIMNNQARSRNPFLVQAQDNYARLMKEEMIEWRNNRSGEPEAVLVIPVVFHVLHLDGEENISDAQIHDQMEVLNRDFNKLNADTIEVVNGFDTIIANIKVEFRLATKDFMGNCTNGIERIRTIETNVGDNGSKLNQWPRERYLNVWTCINIASGPNVLAYSQYPSSVIDGQSALADGVIIRHNCVGRIGTAANFDFSRTLTHEVGHYLDLAHTWGGTNDPEVECGDDGVADTPVTEGDWSCGNVRDFSCSSTAISNVLYDFAGVSAGIGGMTDPTTPPIPLLEEENFTRLQMSHFSASGVSTNPNADGKFAFTGWSEGAANGASSYGEMTGAINTGEYYEFTVTPRPGSAMSLTEVRFNVERSASGPRAFVVRSSANNFATNLTAVSPVNSALSVVTAPNPVNTFFFNADSSVAVTGTKVTMPVASFTNMVSPVTFRIYAFNAEDAIGSFGIDDVELVGTYGVIENTQNYMNYSNCNLMFTNGQKDRMRLALSSGISSRSNLSTEANRALTGTDDNPLTCAPNADFFPSSKFACVDDEIEFFDNSTNGVVDSYAWTFQDGNPSTSTEQNPSVSFTSAGRKTITLTVTNAQGSTTKTIEECVHIAPIWSETGGPLVQDGFDSPANFYYHYVPANLDNNQSTWRQTSTAGYSNNTSVFLNAIYMDVTSIDEGGNDIDELVTPSMDLSNVEDASVTFKYAYATQSTDLEGITDEFEVYISSNCGQTWSATPRVSLAGFELVTAGSVAIPFVPNSASDWREESFEVPSTYLNSGFRMKFVFKAGEYPNNLYIDDINMSGVVSVNEQDADFYGATIYPNPANEVAVLSYTNRNASKLEINLTDVSGRVIQSWNAGMGNPGKQQLTIDTSSLANGAYFVNISSASHTRSLKLMVD